MPRPPMWLWIFVVAAGLGVIYADMQRDAELDELVSINARLTLAERRISDCAPRVVAEGRQ